MTAFFARFTEVSFARVSLSSEHVFGISEDNQTGFCVRRTKKLQRIITVRMPSSLLTLYSDPRFPPTRNVFFAFAPLMTEVL